MARVVNRAIPDLLNNFNAARLNTRASEEENMFAQVIFKPLYAAPSPALADCKAKTYGGDSAGKKGRLYKVAVE
jgi:hypothetical protein